MEDSTLDRLKKSQEQQLLLRIKQNTEWNLSKVNNRESTTMKEICLKLTTKTAEPRFQGKPGVFITYFKRIHLFTRISIIDFEHEFTRRDKWMSRGVCKIVK